MVITSSGKLHVWKVTNISLERKSYIEVMEKTKEIINELQNIDVKVSVIVTDSAEPYAASSIGEVFKELTELKTTIERAIQLATYFNNANNKYFIAKLHDQQKITYKKYYTIAVPGETRLNKLRLEPETELRLEPEPKITENIDNIVEISANETKELADINEEDEVFSLLVGDIIHLAVDSNAKWDRITLFNELPLL
ncbi:hypothetical protein C2G38_2211342 [Gigaspora rosea]|uniref:Uncharacterized protein n=1 Tax=Gigaspora rosea TaxID=44941 RepID=A0A397UIH1_9GLOM|nr:hypothetical protein C2G38_2211342 [Gigaspora rosea]